MPKTNLVVACTDFENKRTENQKLVNVMVDDKRNLGDVITRVDADSITLEKLRLAYNNSCDTIEKLADIINNIVLMLDGVLTEDSIDKLKTIIKGGKN